MGQRRVSRRSWKGGGGSGGSGRSGRRANMNWGPSAEKPHPWAVDHEPWGAMGPGAMGP